MDKADLRPIPGFEDYYISKDGRVLSKRRKKARWLKPTKGTNGYLSVGLKNSKGEQRRMLVHQAVARAWIPNPDNYSQVNHRDENKENNNVLNLEWCTAKYNSNYGTRNQRNSKPVINLTTGELYSSVTAAASACHTFTSTVTEVCRGNGRHKTVHGMRFAYYKGSDDLSLCQS